MVESDDTEGGPDGADRDLQEMIDHWVLVMDEWVRKFDRETGGGMADGAGPVGEAGSFTNPAPEAEPG